MIHAYRTGARTVVVAAPDIAAFEAYAARVIAGPPAGATVHRANALDRMLDADLDRFDRAFAPVIIDHDEDVEAAAFGAISGLTIGDADQGLTHHRVMLTTVLAERRAQAPVDTRTIAEIAGIDVHDPHDRRSDEQKAEYAKQQDAARKAYEDAQKRGQLSSDSFAAAAGSKVQITDIGVRTEGGKRVIDAMGQKDLHALSEEQERVRLIEDAEHDAASHRDYHPSAQDTTRQSRRPNDYLFAAIDTEIPGEDPYVIIVPRVQWLRERKFDDRYLSAALADVLPPAAIERDPGQFFVPDVAIDDLIDLFQARKFHADRSLKDWYAKAYVVDGGLLGLMGGGPVPPPEPEAPDAQPAPPIARQRAASSGPQESFGGERPPDEAEIALTEYLDANGDDTLITNKGMISKYYRLEVDAVSTDAVDVILRTAIGPRVRKRIIASRDTSYGSWFATIHEPWTSQFKTLVEAAGHTARHVVVDRRGVPIEGGTPSNAPTPIPRKFEIRPWNMRRPEWDALTDVEREENRKTWSAEEMLICGSELEFPCTFYVCPADWFAQHKTFFSERLDISHLLPPYVEEIAPWTYRDTSKKDWNSFFFEIENTRKFKFSMLLQAVHNARDM